MPAYYSTGRDPYRNTNRQPARNPQSRNARPAGNRPPQNRRPARRRKKRPNTRFYAIIAAIVVVLIAVLVLVLSLGRGGTDVPAPQATPTPAANASGMSNATVSSHQPTDETTGETNAADDGDSTSGDGSADYSALSELLADEDADISSLSEAAMVQVSDLSVNTSLPEEWLNILLLGSDERSLSESARTDTMIICSINMNTKEVKLTSIMRDTAVTYDDLGQHNGTYRINAANYFGGPEFAMKTVNECFGMNIQYYAMVNFFGFQKIAEALGGIDVDISEAEMNEINNKLYEQYKIAKKIGEAAPTVENDLMTTYGPGTHLNGHQTLAYARVRSIDSDFSRADRQRKVLSQLAGKLKEKSLPELMALGASMISQVSTNMDFDTIMSIAVKVLEGDLKSIDTFRVPVNDSYTLEVRNEEAMFYDVDWAVNQRELYTFIYD